MCVCGDLFDADHVMICMRGGYIIQWHSKIRDLEEYPGADLQATENDKKCPYLSRVLEVEQGTFAPLVFTTTGGMSEECQCYHSHLAELQTVKKQESYVSNIAWIRTQVSFAILRSALVCQRGSHSRRRTTPNIQETDLELEVSVACR